MTQIPITKSQTPTVQDVDNLSMSKFCEYLVPLRYSERSPRYALKGKRVLEDLTISNSDEILREVVAIYLYPDIVSGIFLDIFDDAKTSIGRSLNAGKAVVFIGVKLIVHPNP